MSSWNIFYGLFLSSSVHSKSKMCYSEASYKPLGVFSSYLYFPLPVWLYVCVTQTHQELTGGECLVQFLLSVIVTFDVFPIKLYDVILINGLARVTQVLCSSHHSLFKAILILVAYAGLRRCIIYNLSILLPNDVVYN